jgi:DNA-binding PadR family transcriptional regulator
VLAVFLDDPAEEWHGFDLAQRTKLKSGTLYPLLARLENNHWLQSRWEEVDPHEVGRPRRRFYSLTALGEQAAQTELGAHIAALTPRSGSLWLPRPQVHER